MDQSDIKGFVLAAGLGSRLRPFTDELPKPLFPFGGPTLLELALWRLQRCGIQNLAVNGHHHSEQIASLLSNHQLFANTHFSHEATLLGTGGSLGPLKPWLKNDHVLIYNGDVITDLDLAAVLHAHKSTGAHATMALLPVNLPGKNPVLCGENQIIGIGKECPAYRITKNSEHTFTGIHVLSPDFVARIPDGKFWNIIDTYNEAISAGENIGFYIHHGMWHDMGTPFDYWQALLAVVQDYSEGLDQKLGLRDLAKKLGCDFTITASATETGSKTCLLATATHYPKNVSLGPNVICHANVAIGAGAKIKNAVLLPGAIIKPNESISDAVVSAKHRVHW